MFICRSVRQGLLFAMSMIYLAVPAHILLNELQIEVFESKNWLEGTLVSETMIFRSMAYSNTNLADLGILGIELGWFSRK